MLFTAMQLIFKYSQKASNSAQRKKSVEDLI